MTRSGSLASSLAASAAEEEQAGWEEDEEGTASGLCWAQLKVRDLRRICLIPAPRSVVRKLDQLNFCSCSTC